MHTCNIYATYSTFCSYEGVLSLKCDSEFCLLAQADNTNMEWLDIHIWDQDSLQLKNPMSTRLVDLGTLAYQTVTFTT